MRLAPCLAAACLSAAVAVAVAPAPARAAAGSPLGYALSAVGFSSYFKFASRPGLTERGVLRVTNTGAGSRTLELRPADVGTAATGGLQYGLGAPSGEGRWIALPQRTIELAGGSSRDLPFAVRVPSGAAPGEHFLAITAVDRRALARQLRGQGIRLRLIPRLAMTIAVRLPGPRTEKLALGAIALAVAPSGASLAFELANRGDTLIGSTGGNVTVSQGGTPLFSQTIELGSFVPRTAISFHVPWEGTPVEGSYRVKGVLQPAGAQPIPFDRVIEFGSGAIHRYRRLTGHRAQSSSSDSLVLIALLAVVVAVAAILALAYLRLRKQVHPKA